MGKVDWLEVINAIVVGLALVFLVVIAAAMVDLVLTSLAAAKP